MSHHREEDPKDNERRADTAMRAIEAGTDCEFRAAGLAGLRTDLEDLLAKSATLSMRRGWSAAGRRFAVSDESAGRSGDSRTENIEGGPTRVGQTYQSRSGRLWRVASVYREGPVGEH
jgi:hypothetical protein